MKNPNSISFRTATRALWSHLRLRRKPRPERAPELSPPAELGGPLRAFLAAALWGLAVLIAAADGAAFSESYRGLLEWAEHHGLSGFWAAAFPLQVDVFIVAGELVLFVAMLMRWGWKDRTGAWAVAALGLAVSVAGNIGHIAAHDLQSRGTAAVPPVAAFGALWLGLGVLKRVLRARRAEAVTAARDVQQAAERDALAETLAGLADAVRALAEKPVQDDSRYLPFADRIDTQTGLIADLITAVRDLAGAPREPVPGDAESAARASYRATLLAGNPWPARQLEIRWGLSRGQVARMCDQVKAELGIADAEPASYAVMNGSGPHA